MDTQRIFIIIGLFLTGFLFWQEYLNSQKSNLGSPTTSNAQLISQQNISQDVNVSVEADLPEPIDLAPPTLPITDKPNGKNISVSTDVFDISINTKGGTIDNLLLSKYPQTLDSNSSKVQLFNHSSGNVFLAQSGLISNNDLPNHHSEFSSEKDYYELIDKEQLIVPLSWDKDGINVVKTYHFVPSSYLIGLSYKITNNSNNPIQYANYEQLLREALDESSVFLPTFAGGAVYNADEVYEKIEFDEFASQKPINTKGGWLAMVQHYFVSAWVANAEQNKKYSTKVLSNGANLISGVGGYKTLDIGQSVQFEAAKLYAGPKLQSNLEHIKGLDKTVDYGVLYIIAKPLEVVLHWFYKFVQNWGLSIILLTVLIKLLFYKLSQTSYRSMAKMRTLTPKIQHLKELYGDDRQKMSQKMMALYKQEKVNPASGCLPILVQIPVFIALYWVLLESVELRHVPFWHLPDLTAKDPYFILPLIMGLSMFFQQKLNPPPPDPMQAKIMTTLPFVFTIFFLWFPSGLVLYWTVNNILSIAQQWLITKQIAKKLN